MEKLMIPIPLICRYPRKGTRKSSVLETGTATSTHRQVRAREVAGKRFRCGWGVPVHNDNIQIIGEKTYSYSTLNGLNPEGKGSGKGQVRDKVNTRGQKAWPGVR